MDSGEVGAGHVEASGRGAGGEDQCGERHVLVPVDPDPAGVDVEGLDGAAGQQLDVVGDVEVLVVDACRLGCRLAAQHRLGQRRSFVGQFVLVADEDDPPVEAGRACGFCRLGAGEAGADDHECPVGHESPRGARRGRSKAVARRARAERAEQQPEVAQGDVVEVGLQQQVDDDAGEPGGDQVATEAGPDGDDETGDDLDDTDGEHGLVGVAGNEVVDLGGEVDAASRRASRGTCRDRTGSGRR